MKRLLLAILIFPSIALAEQKPIVVAVIDTGYDIASKWDKENLKEKGLKVPKICKGMIYDFVDQERVKTGKFDKKGNEIIEMQPGKDVTDNHGHGTHIAGLVAANAGGANFCVSPMRYYNPLVPNENNMRNTLAALKWAIKKQVDVINYSGGGTDYSHEECEAIKKALDAGILVAAAAGNEGQDINKLKYYPAMCDDRVVAVSNIGEDGKPVKTSNRSVDGGRELEEEHGENVQSLLPDNNIGSMTGTSQAAAIMTGKLVQRLWLLRGDKYFKVLKSRGI